MSHSRRQNNWWSSLAPDWVAALFPHNGARRINFRLLFYSAVAALSLVSSLYYVHHRQLRNQADLFLAAAAEAESNEQWREAVKQLRVYLQHHDDDIDALERYAKAIDKASSDDYQRLRMAVPVYAELLAKDPGRIEARARLAELQAATSPVLARENAELVLKEDENNVSAIKTMLKTEHTVPKKAGEATGIAATVKKYEEQNQRLPGDVEIAQTLARLYRERAGELAKDGKKKEDIEELGDQVMSNLVSRSQDSINARLARYEYRRVYWPVAKRKLDEFGLDEDLRWVLRKSSSNFQANLSAAVAMVPLSFNSPILVFDIPPAVDEQRLARAVKHLEEAHAVKNRDERAILALCEVRWWQGQKDKALAGLAEGARMPENKLAIVLASRLCEYQMFLGKWEDAHGSLKRVDDIARLLAGQNDKAQIEYGKRLAAVAALLRGRWYIADANSERDLVKAAEQFTEAARTTNLIEQVIPPRFRNLASVYVFFELGNCRAALGQWDPAAAAYLSAINLEPNNFVARSRAANALLRNSQIDSAVEQYRQMIKLAEQKPALRVQLPDLWQSVTRALVAKQRRLPEAKRDWTEVDRVVHEAKRTLPNSAVPVMAALDARLAKEGDAAKKTILGEIEKEQVRFNNDAVFWKLAFRLQLRLDSLAEADRSVERIEALTKQPASQERARLLMARGRLHDVEKMLADAAQLPNADPAALLASRASLALTTGHLQQGRDLLRQLADKSSDDLLARVQLAELAYQLQDLPDLRKWEEELEKIEGQEGSWWRFCRIQRLLLEARNSNPSQLTEASKLARELTQRRPGWAMAHAAVGLVEESRGQFPEAIRAYQSAYSLGDHRSALVRNLLMLMLHQKQQAQAMAFLGELTNDLIHSADVLPLAVQTLLRSNQVDRAIAVVKAALAENPRNSESCVSLGLALIAKKDWEAAEGAFRNAVLIEPGSVWARVALLYYFTAVIPDNGASEQLSALMGLGETLAAWNDELTETWQMLILARCYQLHGDYVMADTYFRGAFLGKSGESERLRIPRGIPFTGNLQPVKPTLWTGSFRSTPKPIVGVFGLVTAAAQNQSAAKAAASVELLNASDGDNKFRLRAVAELARGKPNAREAAVAHMRKIKEPDLQGGDHLLLARVYRALGNYSVALEQYRLASASTKGFTAEVLEWADFEIEHGSADRAETIVAALPDSERQLPQAIRLRLLAMGKRKQNEQAIALARRWVLAAGTESENKVRFERAHMAAVWLAKIGSGAEASALVRDIIGKSPAGALLVADWLSSQPATLNEALEVCFEIASREPDPITVLFAMRYATRGPVAPGNAQILDALIERQLDKKERLSLEFFAALAVLREHQKRPDEAIQITEEALKRNPNDLANLNNLAWFLTAYKGEHQKAFDVIQRFGRTYGVVRGALDTKAVCLLNSNNAAAAVRILEHITLEPGSTGALFLHLAEAYKLAGRIEESKAAYATAQRMGLQEAPPRDQEAAKKLQAEYAPARAAN